MKEWMLLLLKLVLVDVLMPPIACRYVFHCEHVCEREWV